MEEDFINQQAMGQMLGVAPPAPMPAPAAAPMDPMSGSGGDPLGVTNIPVPNFALPAVVELIGMLEQEMMGAGSAPMM